MIRIAELKDLSVIIEYKIRMFRDAGLENKLHKNRESLIKSSYSKLYEQNKAVHFLFEEDNMVVAMAGGFIKDDIPYCFYQNDQYGFIGDMYTIPEYRKKGYASILFAEVLNWIKDKGVSEIRLLASPDGRHMYEKAGFQSNTAEMIQYIKK